MNEAAASTHPDFSELVRVFARIGCINFGGPAGQIALMHRELVDERRWVSEDDYLHALNFCHLLPGPEAQQLATWIGWKLHGLKGGLAAGLLFVIPGAVIMLLLSVLYAFAAHLGWFSSIFVGVKAAVLAIVAQALMRIAGRALGTRFKAALAITAFLALFLVNAPFPIVILGAGLLGIMVALQRPDWLGLADKDQPQSALPPISARSTITTIFAWLAVWAAPMLVIALTLGTDHELWKIGAFFSKLAVVTFGGAYAVLAYMAQEAVQGFHWLRAGEMADGLGLAETTPGPLIMVTQFVGFLAAFRMPAPFTPLIAGFAGAALTTWVTFAPCFLWIFVFAPWIERLQRLKWLKGGLAAITAAVVGVIANLAIWFAIHLLFSQTTPFNIGPVHAALPDPASFDWKAALLSAGALILLFRFQWGIVRMLIALAVAGFALSLV